MAAKPDEIIEDIDPASEYEKQPGDKNDSWMPTWGTNTRPIKSHRKNGRRTKLQKRTPRWTKRRQ